MSWLKGMREKEPPEPATPIGTIVLGTLHPDTMDTAKEMVRKSLKTAQFKTVDAGRGVSPTNFASKAKEVNADITVVTIGLSAAKDSLPKLVSGYRTCRTKRQDCTHDRWRCSNQRRGRKNRRIIWKNKRRRSSFSKETVEQKRNKA